MTREQIIDTCHKYGIRRYTINDDMSISVNGIIDLSIKGLILLPLKFKEVNGSFSCSHNHLRSLEGCPERVDGDFYCTDNNLQSLEFCPKEVSGTTNFTSSFVCYNNNITNFDGLPEFFESNIDIYNNPVYEIYSLFNRNPKCIYYIREFDVIRGNEIIKDRLEEVYVHMGLKMPKDISFKEYILI